MTDRVVDAAQRREALDPQRSFIVQAPAGSGKTGLITQRFLVLLARAEQPEQIVAITFTRKAAGEMRARILAALHGAQQPAPEDEHARNTWRLARAAMDRDAAQGWDLLNNPSRLTIQTIDSLCAWLTRRLPLLSGFGAQPDIAEDAEPLYRQAARQTLADLEQGAQWSAHIASLLRHLDNNLTTAERLLTGMLARRDQWLRHLLALRDADPDQRRAVLEAALANVITDHLTQLAGALPVEDRPAMMALVRFAAANVDDDHPLAPLRDDEQPPPCRADRLDGWRAIAGLLLTNDGTWRSKTDKRLGFPAPGSTKDKALAEHFKSMKTRYNELLARWRDHEHLQRLLHEVRYLPLPRYPDPQWEMVEALCELLLAAAAHQRLVFSRHNQVDFSEIMQSALLALGSPQAPTDLALALDYRIQHLLVDEFQDTSFAQYALLERLTAGWQPGDGRTLFVVGDPMQSIYRFREAEVGLYLQARDVGIGDIRPEPLNLSVNFRSQAGVVEWVNRVFRSVLPAYDDIGAGAVSYSPSVPFHGEGDGDAVRVHPQRGLDTVAEAEQVAAIAENAVAGSQSVALLVRARSHLAEIVPALKRRGLRFRAVEIEQLQHRPVVQDLLSLTRALLHPGDRIAWLAVLRAPWCGLTLADLTALTAGERHATVWDALNDSVHCERLSEDGRRRLARLAPVLREAVAHRRRLALRPWIEGVWLALGGPAGLSSATDLEDGEVFLNLLEALDVGADLPDPQALEERLRQLFALPDMAADERLQLMTVHKSKGLEFDVVILPGLGRKAPPAENRLMMWLERSAPHGGDELLLAPVKATVDDHDATYAYLKRLDSARGDYESGRLLYVAATRARRYLHLIGHTLIGDNDDVRAPWSSSLLALLWPAVAADFEAPAAAVVASVAQSGDIPPPDQAPLRRLTTAWTLPAPPPPLAGEYNVVAPQPPQDDVEYWWAGRNARLAGTLVHRGLQRMATEGLARWPAARVRDSAALFAAELSLEGIARAHLTETVQRVIDALCATLDDPRGRWLLSDDHRDRHCEYALSGVLDGALVNVVMDRTFIDERGTRWIIDYKTSVHEGGDLPGFVDSEQQRYRSQLERYAALMALMAPGPIRLGLYFPLMRAWREWAYDCRSSRERATTQ